MITNTKKAISLIASIALTPAVKPTTALGITALLKSVTAVIFTYNLPDCILEVPRINVDSEVSSEQETDPIAYADMFEYLDKENATALSMYCSDPDHQKFTLNQLPTDNQVFNVTQIQNDPTCLELKDRLIAGLHKGSLNCFTGARACPFYKPLYEIDNTVPEEHANDAIFYMGLAPYIIDDAKKHKFLSYCKNQASITTLNLLPTEHQKFDMEAIQKNTACQNVLAFIEKAANSGELICVKGINEAFEL